MHRWAPWLFVLLWSTGFLGAKLGLPHADPLAFLAVRYFLVIALMAALAFSMRAPWPRDLMQWAHLGVAGLLVHGLYLGGVFTAIDWGLPAGVTALVVGMQPLLTATLASLFLGETVTARQWLGLFLGLLGLFFVVSEKMGAQFPPMALAPAGTALFGITVGALYQKRFCPAFDWRSGSVAQFLPSAVLTSLIAWWTGETRIEWTAEFLFALLWLVLVLSMGAISLLNGLIRRGSAVNVASLFYLTPATTAFLAWAIFDETLSLPALLGMFLAAWGVYLSRR
ncbi:MAG: DMT family transporter [Rhodocyclaceae bacterium]|nr:DMT family transporter [Rhodocyclaceae bacterium]